MKITKSQLQEIVKKSLVEMELTAGYRGVGSYVKTVTVLRLKSVMDDLLHEAERDAAKDIDFPQDAYEIAVDTLFQSIKEALELMLHEEIQFIREKKQ